MTRPPNSENEQEPSSPRNPRIWLLLLGRTGLVLGVVLLVGIAAGAWWARNFVYRDLVPLVQTNLEQLLGRPIQIGKVERFSLTSLRFGGLSVPATAKDPDRVAAKAVEVEFSPLRLLFTRTLSLNVTLIQPDVYVQQDKQANWVTTQLKAGEGGGFIQTELETLRIQDGDVVLDPTPRPGKPKGSVTLDRVNGIARIQSQNQLVNYEVSAQPTRGGTVQLDGTTQIKSLQTNLKVKAQSFQASDLSRLIELPTILQAGRVDGDLTVQLQQSDPEIAVTGTANAYQVTAAIQNVPQKFTNATGRLTFQGQQISLENLTANYGKAPLVANGSVDLQKGFNIAAQVKSVSAKNALDTLNISLPVPVSGDFQANIQLTGPIKQPTLSGTASAIKPTQVDRVLFNAIATGFQLSISEAASQLNISNLRVVPATGGQIVGKGEVKLGKASDVNINLQAEGLSADGLAKAYGFTTPLTVGSVSGNARVTGSLDQKPPLAVNLSNIQATPAAGGKINADGQIQLVPQGNVALNIQAQGLPGNAIAQGYNLSVPINIGGVSANATVTGNVGSQPLSVNISRVLATPEVGGQIAANGQVQLAPQGRVLLNVEANNLPGDAIAKAYNTSPGITIGNVSADAKVTGTLGNLQALAQVQAPTAKYPTTAQAVISQQGENILLRDAVANIAGSTIRARGQLAGGQWQAFVDANGIQLSRFAQVPVQVQRGVLSSQLNLAGTTASFKPETIQATGQATLRNVAGGTVNVRNINLNNGRWQALANVARVQLNQFSEQLKGQLGSDIRVAGTTQSVQLADIRAEGQVRFSQLAVLEKPLTAQIQWNGQQIVVERATAPGLSASGIIAVQLPETGTPQVSGFNLDVLARGYNLGQIPVNLPGNVAVAGLVDFRGQVKGTPETPNAQGNIQLRGLKVNRVAFDPLLTGRVNFQGGQGGELQLAGQQDRIAVNLNSNYRPTSFLVRIDNAVATGKTEGDNLLVNVNSFPVALLESFVPDNNSNLKPLSGQISGDLAVNLEQFSVVGDVAVAKPQAGRVSADSFQGSISYADGAASLSNGQLRIGDGLIAVSGNVETGNNPQFQGQASFEKLNIQSVLQAANIFDFQDFGGGLEVPELAGAEVLKTTPVSLPDADLLTQLRRFAEIEALVAQQVEQRNASQRVPTLAELQGALNGQIEVAGSLQSGINASFNFQGANWDWGQYKIAQVIARGTFADGIVTLLPVRVDLGEGLLAFTGQLGTEALSGQLRVADFPITLLQPFIQQFPVDITGQVDAIATLGGSLEDPSAIGEVTLENATLNQQQVQTGQVNFNYDNARLNFASTLLVTGTQPLEAQGSVPIPLPFASVQPDSDNINVTAKVQDGGLALLNAFNDQVAWVDGQGQVNVEIGGTLNQPTITGTATVNNATFQAQALQDPLTGVTGTLEFNGNLVDVQSVQGQYNNQGNLTAEGIIPIFASQQDQQQAATNPLSVSLQNLDLSVQNLYQGGVSGDVVIGGTVLKPDISGEILLSDGQVRIGQQEPSNTPQGGRTKSNAVSATTTAQNINGSEGSAAPALTDSPIEFTNLKIVLGDDVRITTQPLFGSFVPSVADPTQSVLSFTAKGDLNINGTLAKPIPEGTIRLTGGQVNLFSTQFTLERGYEHTAQFTPSRGLDPVLDVRMIAFVPETSGTGSRILASPLISSEISDVPSTSFGTLRTVRVQARVEGPASQLSDNLQLTSEPRRSEPEIIALLGGSIINTLGQSDTALGIATFAGSTVLGGLQGSISALGQAIGFSEFRIFPTNVANEASRASVLGLAAEGVFDINRSISVSLSRVFLTNEPFRYNVLYRVNDNTLVRGSTDLEDESRLEFEYETRF
jgi:translocation and assembly module TamB